MKTKNFLTPIIWSIIGLLLFAIPAFALDASTSGSTESAVSAISSILKIIFPMIRICSILLIVTALFKFVRSFMEEDSESKIQAVTTLVVGSILMLMPIIIEPLFDETISTDIQIEQEQEQEQEKNEIIIEEVEF